ncbi:hypothetical protein [Tuwongella immobilis]|uniref:Uncharacterized protein n=1 Tax=Tuwongella immobilis TaxID=692036 RepID=A0A6C2YHF3_9BACT|nr:hypothetical protein [Tuwongella immobilis]VIP00681.1 Uncharacterized protein OS=Pirellula staleyi (strain ATCC 27377 / DSM 6068 / ICPB 4128) GN=Psta_4565 PE=4 SV=1 [Tuwongella immobilis]VTR96780.1 Uncharacterized protein OS=Pirellula staleyi (strain ATCC 27377 / DSM 6068 / ICPB 4128) GN=Psta_4565 PE=4 SV=1 [Tuwongella immobilis]
MTSRPTPPTAAQLARVQTPMPRAWPLLACSLVLLAALLAGSVPVAFSIATVFLFAGPHNWFEARYMLGRLPARTGKLRTYFVTSLLGILMLIAAFVAMPWLMRMTETIPDSAHWILVGWNAALVLWVGLLMTLRARQNPRRDWSGMLPVGLMLLAGIAIRPDLFSMALIYAHPLMALWLLDREMIRSRPNWRPTYHRLLALVPLMLLALGVWLWNAPDLPGDDSLTLAIRTHAGGEIFAGISTHLLVAWHTFLEMVHYGVWLVAIPAIGLRSKPWELATIPAARHSPNLRRWIAGLLLVGVLIALTLWACFLVDYGTTRQIYFTIALVHVLAEVPFLLRSL